MADVEFADAGERGDARGVAEVKAVAGVDDQAKPVAERDTGFDAREFGILLRDIGGIGVVSGVDLNRRRTSHLGRFDLRCIVADKE